MKMRGEKVFFLVIILTILLSINLVLAGFIRSDKVGDITGSYGKNEVINGWINISLDEEPANSLLTGFKSNITLLDFLLNNSANFTCVPSGCKSEYSSSGSGIPTKSISLNYNSKYIGLRLTGNPNAIRNLSFSVATNSEESLLNPLQIDILDDKNIDWKATQMSNTYSCADNNCTGCFNSSVTLEDSNLNVDSYYCERITLFASKGYRVGGNLFGSGTIMFKMILNVEDEFEKECNFTISSSGEGSCSIILDQELSSDKEGILCLIPMSANHYKIKFEDRDSCGFLKNADGEEFIHDFDLFAKPIKYLAITSFNLDQKTLDDSGQSISITDILSEYIYNKYEGNCTPECIIPIRFFGINQDLSLSNLKLVYESSGITKTETNFYDIKNSSSAISSDFIRLSLNKANIMTLNSVGVKEIVLRLGDSKILSKNIEIKEVTNSSYIFDVTPHNPIAMVPVNFRVILEQSKANLTYTWDFGDGSEILTTNYTIVPHNYRSMGNYVLTIKVTDSGTEYEKSIDITTTVPTNQINKTIYGLRKDISSSEIQISTLPDFVKLEVNKKLKFAELKAALDNLEKRYKGSFTSDVNSSIDIMQSLISLKIPYKIDKFSYPSSVMIINNDQINLKDLEGLGAGTFSGSKDDYYNALVNWMNKNIDTNIELTKYTAYYRNSEEPEALFSDEKLTITPKNNVAKLYLIINGELSKIIFNNDVKGQNVNDEAVGILFTNLNETKTIEFLYPDKIDLFNSPLYLSTDLSEINITTANIGDCNNNRICEADLSEDWKNCRNDCKPTLLTTFFLIILVIVALVIYILMQEWYKRYYEKYLFSNKNQLFNLINFMNLSVSQGLKKPQIFSRLKEMSWSNEQLEFAWNKFQGKRTGMWEIPVFKWMENKEVERELQKRGSGNRNIYRN